MLRLARANEPAVAVFTFGVRVYVWGGDSCDGPETTAGTLVAPRPVRRPPFHAGSCLFLRFPFPAPSPQTRRRSTHSPSYPVLSYQPFDFTQQEDEAEEDEDEEEAGGDDEAGGGEESAGGALSGKKRPAAAAATEAVDGEGVGVGNGNGEAEKRARA